MHNGHAWFHTFLTENPHFFATSLHTIVRTTLVGHLGMFAVTLRDKRLIGQDMEMLMMGGPNLLNMAYMAWMLAASPELLPTVGLQ